MCGGAPKADKPKKEAPAPAPPPDLILDAAGQAERNKKNRVGANRAGRSSLVTPGLSLGSAAGKAVARTSLGMGGVRK